MSKPIDPYRDLVPEKPVKEKRKKFDEEIYKKKLAYVENEKGELAKKGNSNSIFSFNKMYTPKIITVLHCIVQIIVAILLLFTIIGIFFIPVAFLFIRLFFEFIILIFRIYEELHQTRLGVDEFNSKVNVIQKNKNNNNKIE